jgi:hypothetical protein
LLDLSSSYHTSLAQLNPLVQQQLQHGHGVLNIPTSPLYSQQTQQRGEKAHSADVFSLTFANWSA